MTADKMTPIHYTERWRQNYRIKDQLLRNLLAEFYATAILRFIGTGVLAQLILSRGTANAPVQVNLGWGFAICLSVYSAWKTSGGHVNPAVTIVLYILGKISLVHSLLFVVAQTFGAAFGAGLSYIVYYEAINNFDGGIRALDGVNGTGFIFASFPAPYLSNTGAFIDQMAGTGLLGLFVAFFCEQRNQIPVYLQPAMFGVVATMIGTCYSMNMGSPINPASDFGPRVFAAMTGYGVEMFTLMFGLGPFFRLSLISVFPSFSRLSPLIASLGFDFIVRAAGYPRYHDYFFWVPVVAPLVGAVVGAYSYVFFIGLHVPDPADTEPTKQYLDGNVYLKKLDVDDIPLKQNEV
ncbi:unnamed protein product [Anisakis simplex]|uniref:Aquaporin-9 n=1 Tax=Anisakis simplex TaxID=6269 RepID=A0A0M3JRY2_ANISI|nr:unnamed protein product [Anisakis simplex]